MPRNVVVKETEGGAGAGFMDPRVIRQVTQNPEVDGIASDAREKILRVANRLPDRE